MCKQLLGDAMDGHETALEPNTCSFQTVGQQHSQRRTRYHQQSNQERAFLLCRATDEGREIKSHFSQLSHYNHTKHYLDGNGK